MSNQEAGGLGSGSAPKRMMTYIPRQREEAEQRLFEDYFGDDETPPKYPEENFRRIQRYDVVGRLSIDPILKCTSAIRQLAYGTAPDAFDEYLQIAELHCLIETLSTLDYAHRAKNIKNKPEQFEDLQTQFNAWVKECSDLSNKLESTQNNLSQINKVLADTEGALKKCQYALKERDFVISEQKKAASALAHQAYVLRSDLEKSIQDNASLYMKIAREDKPSAGNRSVVNKLESELAQDVGSLCKMVAASVSQQNEQIQCIEKFCQTFININDKAITDLKNKVSASKNLYISHIEDMENVVRLHKATANGCLDDLKSLASSDARCVKELLAEEAAEGQSIFDELQGTLSTQQDEIAVFARELRKTWSWYLNGVHLYFHLGTVERSIIRVKIKIVDPKTGEETPVRIFVDDGIRPGTTLADLAKLKPIFKKDGSTTTGT
ncbi:kinesin-like protein KIN-5C [Tanacetum coccineum]